jgi:hypothetical protein
LRIRGTFFNYSIVNGRELTQTSGDEEKDRFFDALDQVMTSAHEMT